VLLRPPAPALAFLFFAATSGTVLSAQTPPPAAVESPAPESRAGTDNELDAFMAKVLARREVNRKTLEQYVLDELERFEILGPGRTPLHRTRRDYTWYVRDGMHVRSPVRFNGVTVGDEARDRYETNWMRQERERQARKAKKEKESGHIAIGPDGVDVAGTTVIPSEPRFVSEAYFMDFKFEPGNYYLAGRETLEGKDVLRIEYYPTRLFSDDDDDDDKAERKDAGEGRSQERRARQAREERDQKEFEQTIERRMNKTALITLWVDPAEHQIVRYTFDNVWLDFLPGAWLVRVDDMRASMTMGQPFPGVWLPRGLNIHAGVTLASGSYEASYERAFSEYRLAEVSTKMRVPKQSVNRPPPRFPAARPDPYARHSAAGAVFTTLSTPSFQLSTPRTTDSDKRGESQRDSWLPQLSPEWSGLSVGNRELGVGSWSLGVDPGPAAVQPAQEIVGEIRIHGNAFLTDKEVLDLAGIAVGQPLDPDGIEQITLRLRNSRRFESVEVRKRYRSLTATGDVALVLVVHESPGVRSAVGSPGVPGIPDTIARPVGRFRSKLMFLPILNFEDGYGFTYGGRVSTVDFLGIDERLSVPLTWGGTRRAALEFERLFETGPLTRIGSSVAIWNRENPRFDIRDQRVEVKGRAERVFADLLRVGAEASRSTISFGTLDDRLWTIGTSVGIDTRLDPAFPGNAVLLGAGWTGMHFQTQPDRVNLYTADARGYLRVFRQVVVAGRAQYSAADASLPPYERLLLGGASSLRGFRTGAFDGDRMLAASAEVRIPLTSVLNGAKLGVTAFMDAGKIWNVGQSMELAEWHRGAGGGLFLIASIIRINLDVAHGLKTGGTRVHLSSGFTF
jgi:hypothetical protein